MTFALVASYKEGMPAMLARPLALAALFALVPPFLGPGPLSASTSTCEPFGTVAIDGGAIYQQNEWNSTATQCASVDPSTGAWSLTQADFDLPTNRAPATYPATFRGCHWGDCSGDASFPVRVSDISSATSSWSTTQVSSGAPTTSGRIPRRARPASPTAPRS